MKLNQKPVSRHEDAERSRLVTSHRENTSVTLDQIADRLAIAQIAIDLVNAENAIIVARGHYIERIQKFERKHAAIEGRLDRRNPDHAAALVYTDKTYSDYQLARRSAYNIKRRLETAVRRDRGGIR